MQCGHNFIVAQCLDMEATTGVETRRGGKVKYYVNNRTRDLSCLTICLQFVGIKQTRCRESMNEISYEKVGENVKFFRLWSEEFMSIWMAGIVAGKVLLNYADYLICKLKILSYLTWSWRLDDLVGWITVSSSNHQVIHYN